MTKNKLRVIIGENIRNERVSRNISTDELAEMLGLTPGFIGLIERGQRGATPITLFKLSNIFGMTIDSFFYKRSETPLSFSEEEKWSTDDTSEKRRKIDSLIFDFEDKELDFVISMLKNIRIMSRSSLYDELGEFFDDDLESK